MVGPQCTWRNTPQAHIENKHDEICNNLVEKMSVSFEDTGIVFLNTYCKMHFNHFEPFAVKMENIKRKGIDINKWLGIEKPGNEKE